MVTFYGNSQSAAIASQFLREKTAKKRNRRENAISSFLAFFTEIRHYKQSSQVAKMNSHLSRNDYMCTCVPNLHNSFRSSN